MTTLLPLGRAQHCATGRQQRTGPLAGEHRSVGSSPVSDRNAGNGAWVARAGAFIWVLSGVTVLLDGYVIVVEAGRSGGFLVDRFFLPVICGLLAAGAFAVATSGVLLR